MTATFDESAILYEKLVKGKSELKTSTYGIGAQVDFDFWGLIFLDTGVDIKIILVMKYISF